MARKDIWEKKRKWPIWLVCIAAILIVIFAAYYYLSNTEKVEEYDVCKEGKCVKIFNMHAHIKFDLCGKSIDLPQERGQLDGPNTHKEKNKIHFHSKLPYDPVSGKILNVTPLRLGELMNVIDMRFNDKCVAEYCNGQACPDGKPGTVRMFVNNQPNTEFDQYVWTDKDEILITFD